MNLAFILLPPFTDQVEHAARRDIVPKNGKEIIMKIKYWVVITVMLMIGSGSLVSARYYRGRYHPSPSGNLAYEPGVIQFSPFGGFMMGDYFDAYMGSDYRYSRIRVDDSPTWGMRLGFGIAPNIGLEFQYSTARTAFYSVQGSGFFEQGRKLSDVNVHVFLANVNFDFSDSDIVPYFALGMGTTMYDVKQGSSQNEFTGTIAGGVKARMAPNLALRFEVRGYVSEMADNRYAASWDGHRFYWESRHRPYLSTWDTTLGISYLF